MKQSKISQAPLKEIILNHITKYLQKFDLLIDFGPEHEYSDTQITKLKNLTTVSTSILKITFLNHGVLLSEHFSRKDLKTLLAGNSIMTLNTKYRIAFKIKF
ncbi:MAG: hypothetical protein WC389_17090 [Lutibacter sp.]|jgi:hypothetical protein